MTVENYIIYNQMIFFMKFLKIGTYILFLLLDNTFTNDTVKNIQGYENLPCLTIEVTNETTTYVRASCFSDSNYVCEVRVQTVTYYAWFLANWFSVLMVNNVLFTKIMFCICNF